MKLALSAAKVISQAVKLGPGQEGKFVIAVAATKDAPLATGGLNDPAYSIVAKCEGNDYDTSAIVINVQKGGGLFT